MKINYNYITYEDVLKAQQRSYEKSLEHNATNSLLNTARELFDQSRFEMCIKICEGLLDTENAKQLYDAKKLIALSYYSLKDFKNADNLFFEIAENSNNSDDWFNVVISSTLNKNTERSKKSFEIALDKYTKYGHQRNMPSVQLMLHYMIALATIDEFKLAFEQCKMLVQVYAKLKNTEEKFLSAHALENIDRFLVISSPILNTAKDEEISDLKTILLNNLDDNGTEKVNSFFSNF